MQGGQKCVIDNHEVTCTNIGQDLYTPGPAGSSILNQKKLASITMQKSSSLVDICYIPQSRGVRHLGQNNFVSSKQQQQQTIDLITLMELKSFLDQVEIIQGPVQAGDFVVTGASLLGTRRY